MCHNWALMYDYGLQVFSRINSDYNNFRAMQEKKSFSLRIEHSVKILPCLAYIDSQLCREAQQRRFRRAWLLHTNFSNCCLQSKFHNVMFMKWCQFICGVCEFWVLGQIRTFSVGSLISNKSSGRAAFWPTLYLGTNSYTWSLDKWGFCKYTVPLQLSN